MLDHCGACGTDFAFGLVVCPNCQAVNARLAGDEAADTMTTPEPEAEAEPEAELVKPPRQRSAKAADPAGESSTIGDTSK